METGVPWSPRVRVYSNGNASNSDSCITLLQVFSGINYGQLKYNEYNAHCLEHNAGSWMQRINTKQRIVYNILCFSGMIVKNEEKSN